MNYFITFNGTRTIQSHDEILSMDFSQLIRVGLPFITESGKEILIKNDFPYIDETKNIHKHLETIKKDYLDNLGVYISDKSITFSPFDKQEVYNRVYEKARMSLSGGTAAEIAEEVLK